MTPTAIGGISKAYPALTAARDQVTAPSLRRSRTFNRYMETPPTGKHHECLPPVHRLADVPLRLKKARRGPQQQSTRAKLHWRDARVTKPRSMKPFHSFHCGQCPAPADRAWVCHRRRKGSDGDRDSTAPAQTTFHRAAFPSGAMMNSNH